MFEKANDQDLEGLSAYTIRNLNSKILTGCDISQYKFMNVKEALIDNRLEHRHFMLSYFISNLTVWRASSQTKLSSTNFII
uniref:Uncharacterized protein n=1 Tax=Amphimedon queenslandica TaxID=400682 RepID=A0A1X7V616_AMPQE